MHKEYVSKDDWHRDMNNIREERQRNHEENRARLDRIESAVNTGMTGIHARIDALVDQRARNER